MDGWIDGEGIKEGSFSVQALEIFPIWPSCKEGRRQMEVHSQSLVSALVVLSVLCCFSAYPAYPDKDNMQDFVPTDFNLVDNAVGFIPDDAPSAGIRQSQNLNSALSALEEEINQIQKGRRWNAGKDSIQDETADNLVKEVRAILWKLAAADKLRSQGFARADQSPQKPSKRACFWKYCVTN
ncbi:Urotensin-2B [Varanus komodoensis]|nr:Urotensin-2B [Varanus komodoensis]